MSRIISASLCAWMMLEYTYLKTKDEGIVGEGFSDASEGQSNKIDGHKHPYFFFHPGRCDEHGIYASTPM